MVTLVVVETPVAVDAAVVGALPLAALATFPPSRPPRPHVCTSRATECSTWVVTAAATPPLAVALAAAAAATLGSTPGVARASRSATRSNISRCLPGHASKAPWMPRR